MARSTIFLGVIFAVTAVSLGLVYSGSAEFWAVLMYLIFFVLAPLFFALVLWAGILLLQRTRLTRKFRFAFLVWLTGIAFVGLSGLVSDSFYYYWQIKPLRDYVEKARPVLAKIKSGTGSYPDKLPEAELGKPPLLLQYAGGKDDYSFIYFEPGGAGDLFILYGPDGKWTEWS